MASQGNEPFKICCRNGLCPPQWPACPPMMPFARPIPVESNSTDPNFSILVIAILGILATTFLLVSYYAIVTKCCVRWESLGHHLHRHYRFSNSQNSGTEPWIPNSNGLQESVIQSIPVFNFKEQDGFLDCAVCLNEFQEGERLRLLPKCSHAFHLHCIDVWLQSNSNCPLCRANIVCPAGLDNAQVVNNEISASSALHNDIHPEEPCQSLLQNGEPARDDVSTSTSIDINEKRGNEITENPFSRSPISKLSHVSSLKHMRTGIDCYWAGNIQGADNISTPGQRKESCSEPMQAMRRSFSMDSSLQRLGIEMSTSDGSSSMKKASLFFGNGRGRNAILPV